MSEWSLWCHPQYRLWAEARGLLGPEERALLAAHKALRAAGYGKLDQAFFTELDVEATLARASKLKLLTAAEVEVERSVLQRFAPLLSPLMDEQRDVVLAFRDRLEAESSTLGRLVSDFAAFAESYVVATVPLFLIPNTDSVGGGGGYDAGFMQVEAGSGAMGTFIHEAFHLVMAHRLTDIVAAAQACGQGLDTVGLNEGVAYALSPGILHDGSASDDVLASWVASARGSKTPATNEYVRYQRFGLALRPILESTLARRGTLTAFLPNACVAWTELQKEAWP
jgi:hypothetical protein